MSIIPRNTPTASLRRIPFTLVDATDLVTPEDIVVTGVKAQLSFNGGAFAPSTNDIVKVSAVAGEYYVELTQAESDTAVGTLRGYLQPAGTALTKFEATIGPLQSYDSPATSLPIAPGGISSASFAADAINAAALSADAVTEIVTAVFARAFGADFYNKTFSQLMGVLVSGVAGVTTGAGTGSEVFKTPNNGTTTHTINNDGTNRTAVSIV